MDRQSLYLCRHYRLDPLHFAVSHSALPAVVEVLSDLVMFCDLFDLWQNYAAALQIYTQLVDKDELNKANILSGIGRIYLQVLFATLLLTFLSNRDNSSKIIIIALFSSKLSFDVYECSCSLNINLYPSCGLTVERSLTTQKVTDLNLGRSASR